MPIYCDDPIEQGKPFAPSAHHFPIPDLPITTGVMNLTQVVTRQNQIAKTLNDILAHLRHIGLVPEQ